MPSRARALGAGPGVCSDGQESSWRTVEGCTGRGCGFCEEEGRDEERSPCAFCFLTPASPLPTPGSSALPGATLPGTVSGCMLLCRPRLGLVTAAALRFHLAPTRTTRHRATMSTSTHPLPAFTQRPTLPFDLGSLGVDWKLSAAPDGSPFAAFGRKIETSQNDARQYRWATSPAGTRWEGKLTGTFAGLSSCGTAWKLCSYRTRHWTRRRCLARSVLATLVIRSVRRRRGGVSGAFTYAVSGGKG